MTNSQIIQIVSDLVKSKLEGEGSGHDWWHIFRVWNNAKLIAKSEKCNTFHVELGALLHDIADYKFHDGDEEIGGKTTKEILENLNLSKNDIDAVVHIVDNVSFKGEANQNKMKSLEGKIVQDADRLDALGAIGIARTFVYGGHTGVQMYNPEIKPKLNMSKEEYKTNKGTSVNHFYEKLLLLKDLMNTKTGKEIAEHRHTFMEEYLKEFFAEWDGKSKPTNNFAKEN